MKSLQAILWLWCGSIITRGGDIIYLAATNQPIMDAVGIASITIILGFMVILGGLLIVKIESEK